jgi:hypothetical protein
MSPFQIADSHSRSRGAICVRGLGTIPSDKRGGAERREAQNKAALARCGASLAIGTLASRRSTGGFLSEPGPRFRRRKRVAMPSASSWQGDRSIPRVEPRAARAVACLPPAGAASCSALRMPPEGAPHRAGRAHGKTGLESGDYFCDHDAVNMILMRGPCRISPLPLTGEGAERMRGGRGFWRARKRTLSPPLRGDPLPQAGEGKKRRRALRPQLARRHVVQQPA